LRLLKEFSPKLFGKKATDCEYDNLVPEPTIICGNQIQNTEQLVELPLEQQIFDMIDQEGSKGLLGVEVCAMFHVHFSFYNVLVPACIVPIVNLFNPSLARLLELHDADCSAYSAMSLQGHWTLKA